MQLHIVPTIDDPNDIEMTALQQLMKIGFCYVKIASEDKFSTSHTNVYNSCLNFFRQPDTEKQKVAFNSETISGYSDRRTLPSPMRFEQFFCRPDHPFGPLSDHADDLNQITQLYREKIAHPIIKQILSTLGLGQYFDTLTKENFSSISFPYYPIDINEQYSPTVTAHKDFELITILYINQPGLQVFYNGEWLEIMPKDGYVVVNLGNTLEAITENQCASALHRVIIPQKDKDRMSMGLFIGLPLNQPVIDLVSGATLFETMTKFYEQQLSQYNLPDLSNDGEGPNMK